MSWPGIEPGPPAWEASTLEKSHLDSLFAGYSEHYFYHNILHIKASKIFFTCLISILSAKFGTSSKKAEECFGYGLDKEFLLLKYLSLDQCSNSTGE
jgi:hypothetical protein